VYVVIVAPVAVDVSCAAVKKHTEVNVTGFPTLFSGI
jgi:hypothetical protein